MTAVPTKKGHGSFFIQCTKAMETSTSVLENLVSTFLAKVVLDLRSPVASPSNCLHDSSVESVLTIAYFCFVVFGIAVFGKQPYEGD